MDKDIQDQQPKAITDQSIFKILYQDRWIIVLQILIALVIGADYFFFDFLLKEAQLLFMITFGISILFFFTPLLPLKKINHNYIVYFTFHAVTVFFMTLVAPVGSAYELIMLLLIYVSTYWYGTKGFWLSSLVAAFTFVMASQYQLAPLSFVETYELVTKIIMYTLMGGVFERLHALDLRERRELIKISRDVSFEHQRLRSLINSMADAVLAIDHQGSILVYNGAALDLLNINTSLDGASLEEVLKVFHHKEEVNILDLARSLDAPLKRDDLLLRVGEHEHLNIYLSISPVNLGDEAIKSDRYGYILLLRDITKEKTLEEQRDEFISVVSHELRTPIAVMEANLSTALIPESLNKPRTVEKLLRESHKSLMFLANLVNDITTLSKLERKALDTKLEEVKVEPLLSELKSNFEEDAVQKGLEISLDIKGVETVVTNTYLAEEILTNFLSNAIKYTETGSVVIGAKEEGESIRLYVSDTGIGISLSDRKYVFDRFWRSEDYRTRTHSGVGLGLYLTRKLAERIDGTVGFESELNKGSTFYLDLPKE